MTNGYYIMDGLGAVHSSRLPLDFDVNNDGQVLYDDLYSDLDNEEINEDFGNPINNTVIAPNWIRDREDLPYFGSDFAVDFEMTPSGRGFYLLDAFGGVFAVGDAHFLFPPDAEGNRTRSTTPYFGFPIARGLTLVPNVANPSLGLQENQVVVGMLVLDGLGGVHEAGLATSYNISETIAGGDPFTVYSDIFRDIEITPVWQPRSAEVRNFVVNDEIFSVNVAPEFRNVTAVYSTVSSPQ
jgi:hypothetical protein